jgi:hypothetical protein
MSMPNPGKCPHCGASTSTHKAPATASAGNAQPFLGSVAASLCATCHHPLHPAAGAREELTTGRSR